MKPTYADWLIEQGIDPNAPLPDEIDLIDPICKAEHQQAPEIEATKPQMNEPTTDKMAPHSSEQTSETTLEVQHTQDKPNEETGQKLKADYLGQFQTDLNSFIWSGGSEEETFAQIEHLKGILDLMSVKEKGQKDNSKDICKIEKENADKEKMKVWS